MLSRSVVALVMTTLLLATSQVSRAQQLTPCTAPNCAQVTVQGGTLSGGTIEIPVMFTQAPSDSQPSSGNDDTAAIAFTIGLGADDTPLALNDCADDDSDGLPNAVTPSAAISGQFRVVVENASCTNRNRCLCPTEQGQTKDNFINIVVYGPKDLPTTGPVNIPRLPSNGELLRVKLKVDRDVLAERTEPLTIFAETDLTKPKPQFGAYLSIGDQGAVDQTANRGTNVSKVNVTSASVVIRKIVTGGCVGDCDGNGRVLVNEVVIGVNIALDRALLTTCPVFDPGDNGKVEVNELVQGVNNLLHGCPGS